MNFVPLSITKFSVSDIEMAPPIKLVLLINFEPDIVKVLVDALYYGSTLIYRAPPPDIEFPLRF